jgi:transcriptional regulator with XRE-family HTH domain
MIDSQCFFDSSPMLGVSAYDCKAHMPSERMHTQNMDTARKIVATNLSALMVSAGMVLKNGDPNQSALARVSGADQRTVGRILAQEQSATVDMLEVLAKPFSLDPWQLLIPGLDPHNPPVFVISEAERAFYRKLEELRTVEPPVAKYLLKSH